MAVASQVLSFTHCKRINHSLFLKPLVMKTDDTNHTDEISWQVELAVKPGRLDDFRTLTRDMVEHTKSEHGVLVYERFISEDGKVVYVYERYENSNSAVAHLQAFGKKFGERFVDMVERRRFLVFGKPNHALKEILDPLGAIYLHPLDGFSHMLSKQL